MAKYVTYRSEKGNPFIESMRPFSEKVCKKITNPDGSFYIDPIVNVSRRYNNVRSIAEFDSLMDSNEEVVIRISNDDIDKVNSENIFSDDIEYSRTAYVVLGDFELDGLPSNVKKSFVRKVLLKKPDKEDEYHLKRVAVIRGSVEGRRQYLAENYGGYSDLCYEITDPEVASMFEDSVFELKQTDMYSYVITKVPERYKTKESSV